MQRVLRESLPKRFQVTELEYEIQRMEVDIKYHKTKSRIFEETLLEQQHHLKQLQKSIEEDSVESE